MLISARFRLFDTALVVVGAGAETAVLENGLERLAVAVQNVLGGVIVGVGRGDHAPGGVVTGFGRMTQCVSHLSLPVVYTAFSAGFLLYLQLS